MMTMEQLCRHAISLIHAPIRVYDRLGRRTAIYQDCEELQDLFFCDPEFLQLLLEKCRPDTPLLHIEQDQIAYGLLSDGENRFLIGPCCLGNDPQQAVKQLVKAHHMNPALPHRIFATSIWELSEIVLILFDMAADTPVDKTTLWNNSLLSKELERGTQVKLQQVFYHYQENTSLHNPYSQEQREQGSIRNGDLDALRRSFAEPYVGEIGTLSTDRLRNEKNLAIVLVSLASRSAMEGGVLPEIAYSMSDAYIQKVEDITCIGEALSLAREAEVDFCTQVKNLCNGVRHNPLVQRCKELVLQHLHQKIEVQMLAAELKVNANYLSQLFAKEENSTLSDYIAREKISFAKRQLLYTNDSYEAVACSFAFSSQSHFGRVFKKWTGMTPKQFRDQNQHKF